MLFSSKKKRFARTSGEFWFFKVGHFGRSLGFLCRSRPGRLKQKVGRLEAMSFHQGFDLKADIDA